MRQHGLLRPPSGRGRRQDSGCGETSGKGFMKSTILLTLLFMFAVGALAQTRPPQEPLPPDLEWLNNKPAPPNPPTAQAPTKEQRKQQEKAAKRQQAIEAANPPTAFIPGVKADVVNGEITLTGEIKRSDLPALMKALNSLQPKKINNQLTIK